MNIALFDFKNNFLWFKTKPDLMVNLQRGFPLYYK
jgi:hypothetical protein